MRWGVFLIFVLAHLYLGLPASADTVGGIEKKSDSKRTAVVNAPTLREKKDGPGEAMNRISITGRTYRQIFEPYLNSPDPIFITADTVLSAYNVLLNETAVRFEEHNARRLPVVLGLMWSQIPAEESPPTETAESRKSPPRNQEMSDSTDEAQYFLEVKQRAWQHARFAVGVALNLLGDDSLVLDDRLREKVDTEVSRITNGREIIKPDWFDSSAAETEGIDYASFLPYGPYARSETLRRYFRALRWLQTVFFRTDKDDELLAILLLGKILSSRGFDSESDRRAIENYFNCYRTFWGKETDRDLLFAARIIRDRPADLATVREFLRPSAPPGKDTDPTAGKPVSEEPDAGASGISDMFHIIAPRLNPDDVLFETTTSLKNLRRSRPSGLEICAALGSRFATEQLAAGAPDAYRKTLLSAIEELKLLFMPDSLYNQYLNCLASLIDPPEPDAPVFFSGSAWEIKSCNTVLAGWVQRKAFRARTTPAAGPTGGDPLSDPPAGFVVPEPEFFARLGELVARTRQIFENCGALVPPRVTLAESLRFFADMVGRQRYPGNNASNFSAAEIAIIGRSLMTLEVLGDLRFLPEDYANQNDGVIADVLGMAAEIESGGYDENRSFQALIIDASLDLKALWHTLEHICRRLEVMAHKQLRGVSLSERENYFLADFGLQLAAVMLYGGDSYRNPADDAPVIVSIHSEDDKSEYLYGAVARPRELTILYPFRGNDVFCRGAVTTYYEFVSTSRLSDTQWLLRIDSDERPASPRWVEPIIDSGH